MRALFAPARIALIGASTDATRLTARAQVCLRRHGFAGELFAVNPRADMVLGQRADASLRDVPVPVDFAYVLVGTAHVEAALGDCATLCVPVACVLADGFSEMGPAGVALQARVMAAAQAGGLRLLGTNSIGVIDPPGAIACNVNAALEAERLVPSRRSLVSQSGSVMDTLLSRAAARGFGFAKMIGTGDEADLTAGEVAAMLVDDPETHAILLFLETIRRPEFFELAAPRAHAAGKPVMAYKLGRSDAGWALATTHTGRWRARMRWRMRFSAPSASCGGHAGDTAGVAAIADRGATGGGKQAGGAYRYHHGRRWGDGGGSAGGARDCDCRDGGYGAGGRAQGHGGGRADGGAQCRGHRCGYRRHGQFGAVPPAGRNRGRVGRNWRQSHRGVPAAGGDGVVAVAGAAGVAAFRTPEACAKGVRAFLDWREPRAVPDAGDITGTAAMLPARDERAARAVFASLGIEDRAGAVDPAAPPVLGYPVTLKAVSAEIVHQTEAAPLR